MHPQLTLLSNHDSLPHYPTLASTLSSIMAPGAIHNDTAAANGNSTALKPTARSFHPTGTPDPSKYHASSSQAAIKSEADFAAHNYHPLPIGMHSTRVLLET